MKHRITATIVAASAITVAQAFLTPFAVAGERSLYIYNWSDYIDESIIADFESETGIDVTYDVFDSNEVLETKLLAGSSGYDIVVPSAFFLSRQIEAGVFQKLDKSKLPNLKYVWQAIADQTATYDPDNAYSINWGWGTTGIGINVDNVKARLGDVPLNSWSLVFDPNNLSKLQDCGVMIIDAPSEVFPIALNYLGLDPNSNDADDIESAEELLLAVRPYVQKFNSSEIIAALANGDICLSLDWSPDVFQAMARADEAGNGENLDYIIPNEGTIMWFDQMAIPVDAKNVDAAHEFLNFVMRPEIIARASNYTFVANGIESAVDFMTDEVKNNPGIYPDAATVSRLFTTRSYPPKVQRLVTRAWIRVKTGY